MGWTIERSTRDEVIARQRAPQLNAQEQTREGVLHHRHGAEDWILFEVRKGGMVFDRYIRVTVWEGGAHKELSECEHPYFYGCPVEWLDRVPVENAAWRAQVRKLAGWMVANV